MSKKIVTVTALLLSACVAVYAFWIFNEIEQRMANRQAGNIQKQELQIPVSAAMMETHAAIIEDETESESTDEIIDIDSAIISDIQIYNSSPPVETGGRDIASPRDAENAGAAESHSQKQNYYTNNAKLPYSVSNGSVDKKLIALTFDGGSGASAAFDILDTLASRGVKSTMFLTGSFIRKFPQIVERIAAQGHELANHTMTHPSMTDFSDTKKQTTRSEISRQTVINELRGAEKILAERTGLRFAPLWRSPYGEYNREICQWALEAGYLHIGWKQGRSWKDNLDSNDWVADENSPAFKTPDEVFYKIIEMARKPQGVNGGIVLMHLGTERKDRSQQTHLILGRLIDALRETGYEAVTVSELLHQSEIDLNVLISQKEL